MAATAADFVQVTFKVPAGNVLNVSLALCKNSGGINHPDLTEWLAQQAILMPDGFPRFVFLGLYNANKITQMRAVFQGFSVLENGNQESSGTIMFDEIEIIGASQGNSIVGNGVLIDRLV